MWNTLFTLLLRDILLPKTFHNSALRSRFFLFVCLALFRLRIFSSIFSIFSLSVRHMCLLLFTCTVMSQLFATPWTVSPPVSCVHGDSPGKNTAVGCHALLQGIFLTQRWNSHLLRLLHCRRILYHWVKRDHVYVKPTLIMKTHNWRKAKMEKPKQAFIFYQLIIRKQPFISICLPLFFQLTFHWRMIAFQNIGVFCQTST